MELRTLMALAILVGAASAGPISWDDSKCAQKCSSQHQKFKYETDKTYVYSYKGSSEVQITDSSGDKAEVEMTATVEIGVIDDCEMLLQLRDVSLSNSESSSFVVFKSALEKHPLAFAYDDGVIKSICPSPEDRQSPYVVNIKKAVLSALQYSAKSFNSEQSVKETDISGVCVAEYKPSKSWGSLTIVKTKDLKTCSNRVNSPISTFATPYSSVESAVQSMPLIGGEQRCEQVITEGIVRSVKCVESNVFRPLAGQGMAVESEISMVHSETRDGVRILSKRIGDRSSLLFAPNPKASEESNERDIRRILSELCQSTKDGVTPKTPYRVGQLKEAIQGLSADRIARIYESLESNQICASQIVQDIFVDSLSMAGTKGPIKFMAKLVKEEKISASRAQAWFTMLAFNQNAEPESIEALVQFLQDPSIGGRQSVLGISAFIYNYCDDDKQEGECRDVPAIKQALAALKQQLGSGCKVSSVEEENDVVIALMAFENIGRVGQAKEVIQQCFLEPQNSNVVRHAAFRAFRRVPCDPAVSRKMLQVFKDQSEDAEVRIYAYLGAMRCASPEIVHEIKAVLEKESINQVGAFVWSHVENLQETSSPLKQDLRSIVSDVSLQKKFSTDLRKYSRFIEWSTFSDRLNIGAEAEIAIVRSPKSFLPRSGYLNISTQLFGESVPLLEIGGHMQGLESYAERYFGDQGLLSKFKIEDLLEALGIGEKDSDEDENEIDSNRRDTRSIKKFQRLNLLKERVNLRSSDEPKASAYLSVLGRKIGRITSQDAKEFISMKEAFDIMEILTQLAQKQKVERSLTVQFLDAEVVIPSLSGMKLSLSANGTVTAALKVDGKFDIRNLFTPEHSADIDGYFSPSATVEIVAIMSIDSGVHKPGLKAVFNAHSSKSYEGKLKIKQGRVIDASINLPKDKLEILTIRSNLYNVEKNGNEKPIRPKKYYDVGGCTKQLNKPLGIEFCGTIHLPKPLITEDSPYIMALSDASLQITFQKTDRSMRGYSFHLELPSAHSHETLIYQMEIDTPGSRVDRHIQVEAKLSSKDDEHSVNFKMNSPFKKLQGSASIVDRPELKKARAAITIDESKPYSFSSEIKINRQSGQVQLQPTITISIPRAEPFTLSGSVGYNLGGKQQFSVDLQANRPANKPSFLRGTITKDGDFALDNPQGRLRLSSDISFSAPFLESRLHGSIDKQDAVIATDVALDYKLPKTSRHSVKLVSKIQNLSTRSLTKVTTLTQITSTQFPEENARLKWNFIHKPMEHFENEITFDYGENLESDENSFHMLQVSKLEGIDRHARKGRSLNQILLQAPFLEHDFETNVQTEWDLVEKPRFNLNAEAKYAENKKVGLSFDYNIKSSKPIEMQIELKLATPWREMIYQDTLRERSPNEFEGKTMIQWQRGQRATIDYLYRMKSDSDKTHHEVELKMQSPNMRVPLEHRGLLRITRDTVSVNSNTQYEGQPVYSIEAHLSSEGESKIEIELSDWQGQLQLQNEQESKELSVELKNDKQDVHVEGKAKYTSEPKRGKHSLDVSASWKPDDPASTFEFQSAIEKEGRKPQKYNLVGSLKAGKYYQAKIQGDLSSELIQGPHDLTFEVNTKRLQSISVNVKHEIDHGNMNCELHYSINNEEKFGAIASGKYEKSSSQLEAAWGISLKSPYRKLNGKEFHVSYKQEEDSPKYSVNLRAQNAPSKPYNLNMEYSRDESRSAAKRRAHAILTTPIPEYRSQEATISTEYSRKHLKLNFDSASPQGKRVQALLNVQKQGDKAIGSLEIKTPISGYRSINLNAEADYSNGYSSETAVEVNGQKKAEWKLVLNDNSYAYDGHFSAMVALDKQYDVKVDALSDDKKKSWEHSIRIDGAEISSSSLLFMRQGKNYNGHVQLKNGEWVGAVEMKNENNSPRDRVLHLSTRGIGEPLSLTAKLQQDGEEYKPELSICASGSSECLLVKGTYKNRDKGYSYDRELKIKITKGSDLDISLELVHNQDQYKLVQKAEIEAWGKAVGYEVELEYPDQKKTALVRVKLPSRHMLAHAVLEEQDDKYEMRVEFLDDEKRQPNRKLVIEASHQSSEHQGADVLHSTLQVSHPSFQRPVRLDFELQSRDGNVLRPLEAKMEIDVASDPKKKIMVQSYLGNPNKDSSNVTFFFNIYRADRDDLDYMLKAHIGHRNERETAGYEWHSLNSGKKSEGNLFVLIDHSEEEVHFYSQCPYHRFEAHGEWQYVKKQHFSLDVKTILDEHEGVAKLSVDLSKPCGELTISSEPGTVDSRYHMCVDSEGRSLLTITAETYKGTEKQTDASIVFDRRGGKTLNAHIHWRPELLGEFMTKLVELNDKTDFDSIGGDVYQHVSDKFGLAVDEFDKAVAQPFGQYILREARVISRELSSDFEQVGQELQRWQSSIPSWEDVEAFFQDIIPEPVQRFYQRSYSYISKNIGYIVPFSCDYGSVCYKIQYAYNRHGLEGLMEYVYSAIENMPSGYYKLVVALKDFVVSKIQLPSVSWEPIQEAWEEASEWIQEAFEPIMNSEIVNKIQEYIGEWKEYAYDAIEEAFENLSSQFDELSQAIMETPEYRALVQALKSVFQKIIKEYDNLHLDETLKKVLDYSEDFFSKDALKDSVRVLTLDPENGNVVIELRMPAEANTLRERLQSIQFPTQNDQLVKLGAAPVKELSKKIQSMSTAAKQEWVPPYKARGQVVSGMHYKTFDNSFYDFAGQCSYLLAHDFVDKNFTVLINYKGQDDNGDIDKSIVVIIDDQVIEIDPDDETVTIDDQDTELPIVLKDVTITRRGYTIIVDSRRGLSVTCNLVHDYCSTSISGWYYGKTAGLFGTYDNEPSNDYTKPKGQVEPNPKAFARSWEASSGCRAKNLVRDIDIDIESPKYEICRSLFQKDESPLSDCFGEVDEKEYLRMCARQVAVQRSPQEAACAIAAAYADICQDSHVDVALPQSCTKCQSIHGSELNFGEQKQYKDSPQSADVVFIIEERPCNRPIVKDIDSVARLFDRELLNSGYSSNRFAIVAYGGEQEERRAHSHTARGKLFFDSKDVVLATEKIGYNSKKGPSDAFSAIQFAIRYPFRAGVSKTFVLLTCSPCDESNMKVDYSEIQNLLLGHGIILHTLSPRDIQVGRSPSKSKGIYGLDGNTVYRNKDVSQSELVGTPDLRSQVSVPKDVCIALAQEVHGSFFNTKPLTEAPSEAKSWRSLLARRVALSAEPHQCQQCDCHVSEDQVPVTVCKPCRPNSLKRPVKTYVEKEADEYDEE